MKLVDANILLYAVNSEAIHHNVAKRWLDGALNGGATVAFTWIVMMAFIRLATARNVFARPLQPSEAIGQVIDWLAQPTSVLVEPTARHLHLIEQMLEPIGSGGNLVNDAHLAALAIEHRCEVVTFDRDFARFEGIRVLLLT